MKRNIEIIRNENESFPQNQLPEENEIEKFNEFNNDINFENFLSKKLIELNDFIDNNQETQIQNKNEDSNQNIEKEKEKEKDNNQGLEEILEIIRKAWGDKTYRIKKTPFKRLIKPKKLSLTGRILFMEN